MIARTRHHPIFVVVVVTVQEEAHTCPCCIDEEEEDAPVLRMLNEEKEDEEDDESVCWDEDGTESDYCEAGEHFVHSVMKWPHFGDCVDCATASEYAERMDIPYAEAEELLGTLGAAIEDWCWEHQREEDDVDGLDALAHADADDVADHVPASAAKAAHAAARVRPVTPVTPTPQAPVTPVRRIIRQTVLKTKPELTTVYPFYKGYVLALEGVELETVALMRDTANNMVLAGLRLGDSIADQIILYRLQLDDFVADISRENIPGDINKTAVPFVHGSASAERAMIWCLNIMALEKMKALPCDDNNGTMVKTFAPEGEEIHFYFGG